MVFEYIHAYQKICVKFLTLLGTANVFLLNTTDWKLCMAFLTMIYGVWVTAAVTLDWIIIKIVMHEI